MPTYFRFKSGLQQALTDDPTGANLPDPPGNWTAMGQRDIEPTDGPRIGMDSAEIVAIIARDGYLVR